MSIVINLLQALFVLSLRLYPKRFRLEFENEMAAVFACVLDDASQKGILALLNCTFRELRDGWSGVLGENLDEIQNLIQRLPFKNSVEFPPQAGFVEKLIMSDDASSIENLGGDRREAVFAVLPPILFGLGVALDSLIRGGPWNTIPTWRLYLSIGVGLFPMLIIAVVGLYALAKRMPDWSLTWVGAGYMGFVLLIKTASEELADVGRFIISPTFDILLALFILLGGILILSFAAMRGWRRAALFSIGMAVVFCLSLFLSVTSAPFYRHDLAVFAAPVGLVLSLLTFAYIKGSDQIRILVLLGVAVIDLSPVLVTNQVWGEWLSNAGRPSLSLPLLALLTAVLASGPAMGFILGALRKYINRSKA